MQFFYGILRWSNRKGVGMKRNFSEYFSLFFDVLVNMTSGNKSKVKKMMLSLVKLLEADGYIKEANALKKIELECKRHEMEMEPIKVVRSSMRLGGEVLTRAVQFPVNKETGAKLVEVKFVDELPDLPPRFSEPVFMAILSMLQEWKNYDKLQAEGLDPVRSCLIYGMPGTGKTQLALWIAKTLNLPVVTARLDGLMSSYLGTTSKNIGSLFDFANRFECLLLLDEFDAIAKFRADNQEIGEIKRVVNTLLQNMDMRKPNGFTIGITNHQGLLDPAVWRRFDIQIEIPLPSRDVLIDILENKISPIKLKKSQLRFLCWLIDGGTGADADVLSRWIKKSKIIAGADFDFSFYSLVQEFIFLNSGRVNKNNSRIVMRDDRSSLKNALLNSEYKFKGTEISEILCVDKSTISRTKIKI